MAQDHKQQSIEIRRKSGKSGDTPWTGEEKKKKKEELRRQKEHYINQGKGDTLAPRAVSLPHQVRTYRRLLGHWRLQGAALLCSAWQSPGMPAGRVTGNFGMCDADEKQSQERACTIQMQMQERATAKHIGGGMCNALTVTRQCMYDADTSQKRAGAVLQGNGTGLTFLGGQRLSQGPMLKCIMLAFRELCLHRFCACNDTTFALRTAANSAPS
eukprot:scaffold51747_cov19-Tisochrysis_lutea.AAC.1